MRIFNKDRTERPKGIQYAIWTLLTIGLLGLSSIGVYGAYTLLFTQTTNINMKEYVNTGTQVTTLNDVAPCSVNTINFLANNSHLTENQYVQFNASLTKNEGNGTFSVTYDTSRITLLPNTINTNYPMVVNFTCGSAIANVTIERTMKRVD